MIIMFLPYESQKKLIRILRILKFFGGVGKKMWDESPPILLILSFLLHYSNLKENSFNFFYIAFSTITNILKNDK